MNWGFSFSLTGCSTQHDNNDDGWSLQLPREKGNLYQRDHVNSEREIIIKFVLATLNNNSVILRVSLYSFGASGVMAIVVGYGHGDTSSNPGQDWLHFTWH